MKKKWKKVMATCCAIVMFVTMPSTRTLADEIPAEEIVVDEAVEPEEISMSNVVVGDSVTATVDTETGEVLLYSNGGTLWSDWISKLGISRKEITTIKTASTSGKVYLPAKCNSMFSGCMRLTELDLQGFDSSKVQSMYNMFSSCVKLTTLDLSGFDTSNVVSMQGTFSYCTGLTELNLRGWDISRVTNMNNTFRDCSGLHELDLSSFRTVSVTSMSGTFFGCENLTKLDISNFDTSEVTDMGWMFARCCQLTELDLSKFNTSKVSDFNSMFYYCMNLEELDLSSFTTRNLTDMDGMCNGCEKLQSLDISNFDTSIVQRYDAIQDCENLQLLKTPKINNVAIILPGTMFDENGNAYTRLPILSKSIVLTRKIEEEIISPTPTPTPIPTPTPSPRLTPTPTPTPVPSGFSDVQDPLHPYYKAIYWAADNAITKGYSDGTFGIDRSCTRGEMIMFLWKYVHRPEPKPVSKSPFKDVTKNHAFYKAILWAYQAGVTKGYSDGTFGISRYVSRGEAMMFLWKLKGKPAPQIASKSPFTDVPTNHAFYKAILWGSQNGITKGYTTGPNKGKFGIDDNCTRGQIVTFLYRAR